MDNLIPPKGIKSGIFRCLKTGVNPKFPEQCTPQGGVRSPLLANIALNGIEEVHESKDNQSRKTQSSVRYADDMVIILRPQDDATKILEEISQFLAERGMKVSEKKTKLTLRQMVLTSLAGTLLCKVTENLDVSPQWKTIKSSVREPSIFAH
jgi:ribosome-interacting GTPase 1